MARHRQLRDLILDATHSAAVAVDTDGMVIHVNSQARQQFGLTPNDIGRCFQDLEMSYRPVELRSLIERARHERRTLRIDGAERQVGGEAQYFDILVQPLTGADGVTVATHVTFTDVTLATQLKAEIKRVREDLETAYEELQSTNEELETTNEELQAGNEELETMSEQMRVRSEELDEARAFLEAMLTSIAAGVVVLGKDLKVRSGNRAPSTCGACARKRPSATPSTSSTSGCPPRNCTRPSRPASRPADAANRCR
jgi:two-component system CheB/CheR fusion protein